ncbi:TetR family transcriptional regulator [Imbroritus primus]|uniref:TetR family transcriptional regulator n=1 Tax=Imbroritus primus TaxID=3058603 RepID=UPI003D16094F
MVRRTKEEAQETRNRILDAAENVFHERGVARTSLSDIAHAATVTRGAIYWHFRNKADLFAAMCDRIKMPMDAMFDPDRVEDGDYVAQLRRIGEYLLQQMLDNPQWRKIFEILFHKCEFVEDTEPMLTRLQQSCRESMTRTERTIRNAIERGQLPADLDVPVAVAYYHATLSGIIGDHLFYPDCSVLRGNGARFVATLVDSLATSQALRRQPATA